MALEAVNCKWFIVPIKGKGKRIGMLDLHGRIRWFKLFLFEILGCKILR